MADAPTPGQVCYETWRAHQPRAWMYERPMPWHQLDASTQAHWEAAAQAVRVMQEEETTLLYVLVLHAGEQIQLCGAYLSEDEAGIHLAHARTIMPERSLEVRVCPVYASGQQHRQETP